MTAVAGTLDLGPAPIVDFDGTLARLPVDWDGVRRRLGVTRIEEVWAGAADPGSARWQLVTAAECAAAALASPVPAMAEALREVACFAVLSSNSARAVRLFCRRHPWLHERLAVVVGREELAGPKTDVDRFTAGFHRCRVATSGPRGPGPVVYVGDQDYEIRFARNLGAQAVRLERTP